MFIIDFLNKIKFDRKTDRIGPDISFTHWLLFFEKSKLKLCKKKFKFFSNTADFRPDAYAICCSKICIGHHVVIRPGTMLYATPGENGAGITINDDVLIGSGVHLYTANHIFKDLSIPIIDQGHDNAKEIILKRGCWIGANSTILPGVTIGENAVIGAGSIFTMSIPNGVLAAGNPAKIIKTYWASDV